MAKVNFISTTLSKYTALESKDTNTLYFIEDATRIYKGETDITQSLKVVSLFDVAPGEDIFDNKIYMNLTTFEVRVKNGASWSILSPGYISTSNQFIDANSSKLATVGAIKAYITKTISDITGGTAFVKDITFDSTTGSLKVDKGGETATSLPLTGVAHSPKYDASKLKLTIPVVGGSDIVVDIPKDKFVTAGTYNSETQNIELTIEGQTDKVLIPAAALVDTYVADNTSKNITVSVSSDNKISASLTIDPTAGNALKYTSKGFMVNVSNKVNTYGAGTKSELILSDATGNTISRSGVTVLSDAGTTALGTSTTTVPVASIIARAITAAVNTAKTALTTEINKKATKLASGAASQVLLSTADGNYSRSGKTIGGATLSATANSNTLATEAAVVDAISWKSL